MKTISNRKSTVKVGKLSKDAWRIIRWLEDHIGFYDEGDDIDRIEKKNEKSHRQALIEILAPHPECQLLVESCRLANEADAKREKFRNKAAHS